MSQQQAISFLSRFLENWRNENVVTEAMTRLEAICASLQGPNVVSGSGQASSTSVPLTPNTEDPSQSKEERRRIRKEAKAAKKEAKAAKKAAKKEKKEKKEKRRREKESSGVSPPGKRMKTERA